MRFLKKYKLWSKRPERYTPLRVLKFKKSKWKQLKKVFIFKRTFFDTKKVEKLLQLKHKILWKRLKFRYKQNLLFKLKYKCRYDFSINTKNLKKYSTKHKTILNNILKFDYRVDILLWKLRFFKSTYEARQNIQMGNILLNNKSLISVKKYLKSGDFLQIICDKTKMNGSYLKKEIKSSFLEIDYYTKTLIIIKDLSLLETADIVCNVQDTYPDFAINNLN